MKIIDAFWEKRNLGVSTTEFEIYDGDLLDDIKDDIINCSSEYIVVKLPAGNIDTMFWLESQGYNFMECSIHVTHDLQNMELSPIQKRIDASVTYEKMESEDLDKLFQEIKNGLFATDRVSLDKAFSKEQAANRYIGWINDEISRGCEMFKLLYKENVIGFFAFKEVEKDVYYPFLAGMYSEFQKTGLGSVFNYKPMVEAKKRNGKKISTYISTNNSNTVRMHVKNGFEFGEIKYIYLKHNGGV